MDEWDHCNNMEHTHTVNGSSHPAVCCNDRPRVEIQLQSRVASSVRTVTSNMVPTQEEIPEEDREEKKNNSAAIQELFILPEVGTKHLQTNDMINYLISQSYCLDASP